MIAKLCLGATAAVVWSVAALGPMAAACPPDVSVKGDDQDVKSISRGLARFHVSADGETGCATWQVTVSHAGGHLVLRIDDGRGLTLIRLVRSPDAAAAVIDSWIQRSLATTLAVNADLSSDAGPLRAAETRRRQARIVATHPTRWASVRSAHAIPADKSTGEPAEPALSTEAEPSASLQAELLASPRRSKIETPQAVDADQPVVTLAAPPPVLRTLRRGPISVGLGAEASVGNDRSVWWGGHVSGCVTVGAFCVGLFLRGNATTLASQGEPGTISRRGADGLAFVGLPIALRGLTLMPEVGLGAGIRQTTAALRNTDPGEPMASNGDHPGGTVTVGLRSMASLTLVIPLWRRLAIDVSGVVDGAFVNRFRSDDSDGAIPREPNLFLRGGVALRYGTP